MARTNWIGETLNGRYRLDEKLGQGGMATVYKATDPNLRRVVAIKLIHPHLSENPDFVRRFEEEAAAVAQLRHPNIVQVHDFSHDDDLYYIVFEFVPGESLQARHQRYLSDEREVPLDETVAIIAKVADALDYAHKRNLVHRDVKPANVMINIHKEPILMDFGIVKIAGGTQHTATGAVLGTARYMAPEQIRGEKVDSRTDIYSLGAMLYELVSGRPPFDSDSAMTVMMMHVSDPLPDVRQFRPNLPLDLVAIIDKALAKKPSERYQTAAEMAVALRAANLDAAPIVAPPIAPLPEQTFVETPSVAAAAPVAALSAADTFIDRAPQAGSGAVAESPPLPPPPKTPPPTAPPSPGKSNRLPMIIGAVALFVLLVVLGITVGPSLFGGGDDNGVVTETDARSGAVGVEEVVVDVEATDSAEKSAATATASANAIATESAEADELATAEVAAAAAIAATATADVIVATESAEAEADDGSKSLATATPVDLPTATPTPKPLATATPVPATATPPPATTAPDSDGDGVLDANDNCPNEAGTSANNGCPVAAKSVRINSITLDGNNYVVNYATTGYTPQLPGEHIHFFFNTVSPDQAGVPGGGPWILYGGPNPFTQYTVGDKPANATQMCALVANSDHSVIQGTGNCVTLP
jgi:serine/threonine protein kinase